jgi:hypothetical protein
MAFQKVSFNGSIQLSGFREARAKLKQTPPFYSPAVREFFDALGKVGRAAAQAASPHGATGKLAASNVYAVDKSPFPTWMRVKNTARAKGKASKRQTKKARAGLAPLKLNKGVSYPAVLNYGDKKRGRTKHIGWFTRAMRITATREDSLLAAMGDRIQKEWAS